MAGELAIHGGPKVRSRPFASWPVAGGEEEAALLSVLRSGMWGIGGRKVRQLERAFGAYHECAHGVAVCNGTVALHVALLAAGVGAGDEVIVPPYTFVATAAAVVLANCTPVFVDVVPETCCIDPAEIEPAVTPRTKAVIPVHLAGRPAEMDAVLDVAGAHGLVVIEDCAQAHGAEYHGKRVGSLGDMGCFSFQSSKNLAAGEGGMVLTNDADLHERCESIHNCGRARQGKWYGHEILGANYRMAEFQAALLLAQMARLDEQMAIRETSAASLDERLRTVPGIEPLPRGGADVRHANHLYVFRYDAAAVGGVPRQRFIEAVHAEGIPIAEGYGLPIYRLPWFRRADFGPFRGDGQAGGRPDYGDVCCPACQQLCAEALWLPQQVLLGTAEDIADIVRALRKVHDHRRELLP